MILSSLCLAALSLLALPQEEPALSPAPVSAALDGDARATEAESAVPALRPTMQEIFEPPTLYGVRPTGHKLSASGEWVTYAWTDEHTEDLKRHLWLARTDGSDTRKLFDAGADARLRWHATDDTLFVTRDGWLFVMDPALGELEPLLELGENGRFQLDEDGELLVASLGEDNQLWVLELATGRQWRAGASLSGRSKLLSLARQASVVALWADAPVEVSSGREAAHDETGEDAAETEKRLWVVPLLRPETAVALNVPQEGSVDLSADGRFVLQRQSSYDFERELIMADYLSDDVRSVDVRDSLAGDDGTRVDIQIFSVETGEGWEPPLAGTERWYLRGEHFAPTGSALLIDMLSNDFKVRQLAVVDPVDSRVRIVAREYDEAWIGAPFWWSGWEDAGNILYTSEESGFNHLYRVPASGGESVALTEGEFEIRDVCQESIGSGAVLMSTTVPGDPASHRAFAILADGSGSAVLSPPDSVARLVCMSKNGAVAVSMLGTLGRPADLYAQRVDAPEGAGPLDGITPRVRLTYSVPETLDELQLPAPEIIQYTNPDDGATVHAYLYPPEPFEPDREYPLVVFVHGAGSLQQVLKSTSSYAPNMLFHHRLARQGFWVLDPDFRHSTGYGRDFRAGIYGYMGGKDLDDVVAGVKHLEDTVEGVDTTRVGIYGGSYGGFLTLMALFTQPDVFAAGAALRSVTDWRKYNHWYTNARLGDPVEDAENYARSSPLDHVDGLQDPLLILHGLKDSNVFAQDSIRLIEELIERGKDFDAMLYPSQGHGFSDPDSWIDEYKRIERLFVEELAEAD